jgi:glycosyltransferase involved in cell wall biosynthesis
MHVGLDALPLMSPRTGVGHYTLELARALAALSSENTFELLAYRQLDPATRDEVEAHCPPNLHVNIRRRYQKWWAIGLPQYMRRARLDLFHGTNYEVPLWNKRRNVLTIHDLSLLLHPDKHETNLAQRARRRLPIMVRSASIIITATEHVKREICENLGASADRVRITPYAPRRIFQPAPGTESLAVRRRLGIEEEFILFVGTLEPRKNLYTLVRAFEEIIRSVSRPPQLVIAGGEGWLMDELTSFADPSRLGNRLRLTGYLPDEDLRALYSSCIAFVFPSIYEGFGLPPLEAMACGAPVIASDIPVFRETLGKSAQLVDTQKISELATAIVHLLTNEGQCRHLASAGQAHAQQFSWHRTARLTLAVYEELLNNTPPG